MGRPVVPARSGVVRSLANGEGRFCCGSRMSGDAHVRFYERLGAKLRGPTHPVSGIESDGNSSDGVARAAEEGCARTSKDVD